MTGMGSAKPTAEASAPSAIDHGSGLTTTPRSASRAALAAPCSSAPSSRDSAMHSDDGDQHVDGDGHDRRPGRRSTQQRHQQRHAHEAGVGKGRHQRAEGGVVPADAPPCASARSSAPPSPARTAGTPRTRLPSSSCAIGVLAPKRYSMHGSAKYSTKVLSPGMAASGSSTRRAAR